MTETLKITRATAANIPAIKTIADATELFPADMVEGMISPFLTGEASHIWQVASLDGAIVGFSYTEPERMTDGTFNLLAIGVLPDCQGQGVGARMVASLEDELRQTGARVLLVETLGTEDFERTRQFYHQTGYTQEACIRDFYEEGGDKIVFWKHLQR